MFTPSTYDILMSFDVCSPITIIATLFGNYCDFSFVLLLSVFAIKTGMLWGCLHDEANMKQT